MKIHGWIITLAVVCYTQADLWSARCDTACSREGYDSGRYSRNKCICEDKWEPQQLMKKKLKLPTRARVPSTDSTSSKSKPWYED